MRYFRSVLSTACFAVMWGCASSPPPADTPVAPPEWFIVARDDARESNLPVPLLSEVPDRPANLASRAEYAARVEALIRDGEEAARLVADSEPRVPMETFQQASREEIQSILDWYVGIEGQTRTRLVNEDDDSS